MLRRPWFWTLFVILSVACTAVAFRIFPQAFPLVSLDIQMDRTHAIRAARELAQTHQWGPTDSVRDAASFGGDGGSQSFIELEGGGKEAFAALLRDDLYSPYAWNVRLFKESETRQAVVSFKPGGQPYGFAETLREQDPGAALAAEAAKEIAERAASAAPWQIPFERYALAEKSQVVRPGGRVDHTFIYERPDRPIGEGRLRLELVVSGDRLTTLDHFIKVPEAFARRFEEMRSANHAIATAASVAMVLLYLIGGCCLGLSFLIRQRAVLWKQPLIWGGVIGGLQLLAAFNAWPLQWLGYDTALSSGTFIAQRVFAIVAGAGGIGFTCFLSFLAAEGLSRRAFPHHPQFWKLWSRDAAPTTAALGRTLAGYLLAGAGVLYVSVFYFFALRRLGWWTPSDAIVDPNSLAHLWPWLTPFATAAQAGFWEESLFRAVPLAGAALLGSRFGGRRWWIAGAFVLQAVIFAGAHANYPGLPAYSRLVELLVPSFVFAALYLRFGLLPGVMLHFVYDVVLMSLPLFAASADGVWLDRSLIVLLSLAPVWVILWRRWQAGAWRDVPANFLNAAWQPPAVAPRDETPSSVAPTAATVSPALRKGAMIAGIVGIAAWFYASSFKPIDAPLNISRGEAIAVAQTELTRLGVKLPAGHRIDATVPDRPWEADRFVWQTAGRDGYSALLGSYLPQPRWIIRFANFSGDVAERAEEWNVSVTGDRRVLRVRHQLPEARAGASLSEDEARARVHTAVREAWNIDPSTLTEISATSAKRPNRIDWAFTFKDPAVKSLGAGEARRQISLAGDEVVDAVHFIFTPEDWDRFDRSRQSFFQIGGAVKSVVTGLLILAGIGLGIAAWSRGKFSVRIALFTAAIFATSAVIAAANQWPSVRAGFSTARPLQLQQTLAIVLPLVGVLISSAGLGLIAGLVVRWLRPPIAAPRDALSLGAGITAAAGGAFALAALLQTNAAPPWPPLGIIGTFSAPVATLTGVVAQLIARSLVLLLLFGLVDRFTAGWQRRRALGAILVFLVNEALLISWGALTVTLWLAVAGISASVATAVYFLALRRDLTLVPLACGVWGAFNALGEGLPRAYPGALPTAIVAAMLFITLGWCATRFLRRFATTQTTESI